MIDLANMTVLIVDDMDSMCKSIRGMLKVLKFGKKYRFASNGKEALKNLRSEAADLVISDWNMPLMNGAEMLAQIREDKSLRDTPIVMVTAEANSEIVAEAAESDIDAYILKPLTVKALGDKIISVVEQANNPPPMVKHLKQARELDEKGDITAAIAEIKKAISADPETTKPIRELGYLYLKNNQLEEAEKWLLKAAMLNKMDVFAFHHLGEVYLKKDDIERASAFFEKAMNISPRHISRSINFGKILVKRGNLREAARVFDKAMEISENSVPILEEIAGFYLDNAIFNQAIEIMEKIVQQDSSRNDIMYKLGVAYEKTGEHTKAIHYLVEAEKKDANNINLKLHIAKNYIALNHTLRADQVLKAVLKIDPENQMAKEMIRLCV